MCAFWVVLSHLFRTSHDTLWGEVLEKQSVRGASTWRSEAEGRRMMCWEAVVLERGGPE